MFPELFNTYAEWRQQAPWQLSLLERSDVPSEDLLQAVWFHQRLMRDHLKTLDGRRLRVLHPGFWNHEAGPDFRDAIIQIGDAAPVQGDVEIDLKSADWKSHHHDTNPNFRNVALHVIWRRGGTSSHATLELEPVLDSPIEELRWWHGSDSAKAFPDRLTGNCCAPLRELPISQLREVLAQAAIIRLHAKASVFQARARQAGWEQSLWEGLFRGLGYKRNTWPMLRLGEVRDRFTAGLDRGAVVELQARLLGVSGLLPDELTRRQQRTDDYLRRLWNSWWRERDAFGDCQFPKSLWNLGGIRPANHPQRRLALAAHWLAESRLNGCLEDWCTAKLKPGTELATLHHALNVPNDPFWNHHWTLRSASLAHPQPMLGAPRVTDLAVNAVLPWLWVRAVEGRNEPLRLEIERRYFAWPAAEDNAVLKLARQRLLGGRMPPGLQTAAIQQGLLQVVRDFCGHSNSVCAGCRFPDLIRSWRAKSGHTGSHPRGQSGI